jgi:hypothetical protein
MQKISRSAVEQHINCQKCFYLAYNHKIRPFSLPFTLNSAVDNLCKNEFDHYRAKSEPHPLFLEHGIDAVPFAHEKMNEWRENRRGIRYIDETAGFNFGGAVDDVWQKPSGELIIVDVKATSKKEFDWEDTYSKWEYAKGYQRQLEMYQWLFKKNGFEVAPEAYLVYYNGKKNEPMFNQRLEFDLHLVKLECNCDWVEDAILAALKTLQGEMPKSAINCPHCNYLKDRWEVSQKDPTKLLD